jgi:glycosyltransferase involved in cell wall biosynthesis
MIEAPLPFGNAAGRWFHVLLRELVRRGHSVTAFAACSKAEEIEEANRLFPADKFDLRCYPVQAERNWKSKIATLQQPHSYLFTSRMREDLNKTLAAGVDVLHLEQLWSGWLGLEHRHRALLNVHYSFDIDLAGQSGGSITERARRMRTRRAERDLLRAYPMVTAVSPRLADEITRLRSGARAGVMPFAMDTSLYTFAPERGDGEPTVGLVGSFNWAPSRTAGLRLVTRLWPAIHKQVSNARLQIVGRSAVSAFGSLGATPGVEIYENVPDSRPYFHGMDVFLYAPASGSGVKVKILEAFALGSAVVTNQDGVEGIPALDGVHASVAESDADLVDRAVQLLRNPDQRNRQRRAARQLVEEHCNPEQAIESVERMYDLIAGTLPRERVA